MSNNLMNVGVGNELVLENEFEAPTPDYYVEHYEDFLPLYISSFHPRSDTMATYKQHIDAFIKACEAAGRHPLSIREMQMRVYASRLIESGHMESGVSLRLSAIRAFFGTAKKLGLIKRNPCDGIHVTITQKDDDQFKAFTLDQIQEIVDAVSKEECRELKLRNQAIVLLMAVQGLRVVEVMRMNDEDIDWDAGIIKVHGKGHEGTIYPDAKTLMALKEYIDARPTRIVEGSFTPTFVSFSKRNYGMRIQRNGIRKMMDKILTELGYKEKGVSCHALRHSCGTNLYAATKDLRVVQETLRQRDPKVTARYAHVAERLAHRATAMISPNISETD